MRGVRSFHDWLIGDDWSWWLLALVMIGGGWIVCAFVAGACLLLLWLCSSLLLATSCCWLCYSYYIVRSRAAQLTSCQCFTSERRLLLNAISRLVVLPCCCLLPSLCFSCASSTVWRDKLTKELNSVRNLPLSCNDENDNISSLLCYS